MSNRIAGFASTAAPPALARASLRGLHAEEIRALQAAPLFSVQGFSLQGGELTITGLILAPDGDPAAVSLSAEPGIVFAVDYPLANPTAGQVFWYWPNAGTSAFRLRVDLAATRHEGTDFRFRIHFAGRPDDVAERLRTTILVPKDLGQMQNFPGAAALSRVHRFHTINNVVPQASADAFRIVEIARLHGFDPQAGAVLDWGTGHGRVIRFLRQAGAAGALHGTDIDPDNIAWAASHLPGITFTHGPLMPPSVYGDGQFGLVFGISVMTHLAPAVQQAWLVELDRILAPGGIALLTFTGNSAVAYSSQFLDRAWLDDYLAKGFGRDVPNKDLAGLIPDTDYYRDVKQTAETARQICARHFAVEAIYPCMFGYQDLLVLKKARRRQRRARPA